MKGKFITFEGGDGSGKSSHARLVAERLQKEGFDVVLTREPGDTPAGKIMREIIIEHTLHPRAELLLFLADRAQHIEELVRPSVEAGKIVICDRFSGSTFAYQVVGRNVGHEELITEVEAFSRDGTLPDLTLFLDLDTAVANKRRMEDTTQEANRFDEEEMAFHERVRNAFIEQATQSHWVTVDTSGPQEENHEKIYSIIKEFLS